MNEEFVKLTHGNDYDTGIDYDKGVSVADGKSMT